MEGLTNLKPSSHRSQTLCKEIKMSFDAQKAQALEQASVVMMAPIVPIVSRQMIPVGKPNPDTAAANKKADGAKGKALAEKLFNELLKQEVSMVRYLRNVAELGQEGRTEFRKALAEKGGVLKELLALNGCTPEDRESFKYQSLRAAHASHTVRMSEFKVFSEACDMGFDFSDEESYPSIISAARLFKQGYADNGEGNNAVGPTRRRGRPATPFADKFKKFLADNVTEENHAEAREFFNTWLALQNFGKEAPAA
jgi:hypothetical protein